MINYQGDLILTVNAGSSSIKVGLFAAEQKKQPLLLLKSKIDGIATRPRLQIKDAANQILSEQHYHLEQVSNLSDAFHYIYSALTQLLANQQPILIGHRVVHGGSQFSKPILISQQVIDQLTALTPLAPLHQPHNIAPMQLILNSNPKLPQVACFDTAFHTGRDTLHELFALPYEMYQQGIKRYGFHGLSFEYISYALQRQAPTLAKGKVIIAHLGNGAGLCAIKEGKSVEVTTSFTALDGLPMATRCGSLDAGVILHLLEQGYTHADIEKLLYKESGLLGISSISSDMRTLKTSDQPQAQLAIDYYALHIAQHCARLATSLGGLDALVFTAGIGEKDASLRAKVIKLLTPLFNFKLDETANQENLPAITHPHSPTHALVIPTDEEQMIANHAWQIYQQPD